MTQLPRQETPRPRLDWSARIRARLRESVYQDIRRVQCRAADNRIVLTGVVSSYFLKQAAFRLVRDNIDRSIPIDNQLEVAESSPSTTI